ncbi:hypothetical protein LXL04_036092 [Taraxacum kok-saghyz]
MIKVIIMESTSANDLTTDVESTPLTVLDATRYELQDLESIDLPPTLIEIDLTGNRLTKLDSRISHLSNLKKLSLRQNLFDDSGVDPISQWNTLSGLQFAMAINKLALANLVYKFEFKVPNEGKLEDLDMSESSGLTGTTKSLESRIERANRGRKKERGTYRKMRSIELWFPSLMAEEEEEDAIPICGVRRGGRRRRWKKKNLSCGFLLAQRKKRGRGRSEELLLTDNQLQKIPDVSIFKALLVFDVSFNEISSMVGLSKASSTLEGLMICKTQVTKIEEIQHLYELRAIEFSSNKIRVMENLHNLTNLQELYLGRNRIKAINLCSLKCIKKLSLHSNRLTSMKGLEECRALERLYLAHNGITKMEGLSTLANLQYLDVSSNKLAAIEDIEKLTWGCLLMSRTTDSDSDHGLGPWSVRLIMSVGLGPRTRSDLLPRTRSAQYNRRLRNLPLMSDSVRSPRCLVGAFDVGLGPDSLSLVPVRHLWFNDNQIASLSRISVAISGSRENLETIHLENNPCAQSSDYLTTLRQIFPHIQQIDSEVFA